MKSRKLSDIGRVLCDLWNRDGESVDLAAEASQVHDLLATGAGEEEVVACLHALARERLDAPSRGSEELIQSARNLLKLGVRPRSGWRRRRLGGARCSACGKDAGFSHGCPCGFRICQSCLDENSWGMTCNGITWECPDCGRFRSF